MVTKVRWWLLGLAVGFGLLVVPVQSDGIWAKTGKDPIAEGVDGSLIRGKRLKKPGVKRQITSLPEGTLDPNEPRPAAAPIDPVVSLSLLEAQIAGEKGHDASQTTVGGGKLPNHPMSRPDLPHGSLAPSPAGGESRDSLQSGLAVIPNSGKVRAFAPSFEVLAFWQNLRQTPALGEFSHRALLQRWQELTADLTSSRQSQAGFQALLNSSAVLIDGRDRRLALESLRQRSRLWLAVQNGFDFTALPLDESLVEVAPESRSPNYRPPTRYDDLRGAIVIQTHSCPLVTRYLRVNERDWLISCSNLARYRMTIDPSERLEVTPFDWRESPQNG
ncbi:MAG: hypothetical protein ORO03_07445 [Alphaproteobacteria bacterium]|nr:hypothetical protein [Alphaproteobacteria bacterium]